MTLSLCLSLALALARARSLSLSPFVCICACAGNVHSGKESCEYHFYNRAQVQYLVAGRIVSLSSPSLVFARHQQPLYDTDADHKHASMRHC